MAQVMAGCAVDKGKGHFVRWNECQIGDLRRELSPNRQWSCSEKDWRSHTTLGKLYVFDYVAWRGIMLINSGSGSIASSEPWGAVNEPASVNRRFGLKSQNASIVGRKMVARLLVWALVVTRFGGNALLWGVQTQEKGGDLARGFDEPRLMGRWIIA